MTEIADAPAHASRLRGRPVVLALDASPAALAAARLTAALSVERGARPHALHAFDTALPGMPDALQDPAVTADVRALHADLAGLLGEPVDWPLHIGVGSAAGVIVRGAAELGAALVVMGLRHHGTLDRVLRDETTLGVMRAAPCPVLGVTPSLPRLPRAAVVGVDFAPPSLRAARAGLDLLADAGTLVLAYVEPDERDADEAGRAEAVDGVYAQGVDAAFARLETDLAVPAGVTVRHVRVARIDGQHVARMLRAVADRHRAELLAVGSRRHDWLDRALLGSVTFELARDGRHPLLVVPPTPAPARRGA